MRFAGWLGEETQPGLRESFSIMAPGLRLPFDVTICSPADTGPEVLLPLLLVHDGPAFDERASIVRFSAAMTTTGRLPAHRLALLAPGERDRWYSALPAYADALHHAAIPAVAQRVATAGRPALAGASLGALAALHASVRSPGAFSGLFLQSGSFFDRDLDPQERAFSGFTAITDFVESLVTTPTSNTAIGMTCGVSEDNLANNRKTAVILAAAGYQVELAEVPDAHTYDGWRDALDPHLVDLLLRAWACGPAPRS